MKFGKIFSKQHWTNWLLFPLPISSDLLKWQSLIFWLLCKFSNKLTKDEISDIMWCLSFVNSWQTAVVKRKKIYRRKWKHTKKPMHSVTVLNNITCNEIVAKGGADCSWYTFNLGCQPVLPAVSWSQRHATPSCL